MNAHLRDAIVLAHGFDDPPSFGDAQRKGFLHIDIFAGFTGMDGLKGVPMIRSADDDSIDIFFLEQFAVILEVFWLGADFTGGKIEIGLV